MAEKPEEKQRQRAPSQRSLETRKRIFDSAEQVFAERGYEGASIRDIARLAGVQGALVHHHGGGKEELFFAVIARRADELAQLRLDALDVMKARAEPTLREVLACFIVPFFDKVLHAGPGWSAYGRLIAHVSSDERWRHIAETCFDPTAKVFLDEIHKVLPQASGEKIGTHFVFMVSSMLSICTSRWRIEGLSTGHTDADLIETLLAFCQAGFETAVSQAVCGDKGCRMGLG